MSGHRGGRTTVVLFTRDLRVHDHPALAEAAAVSDRVVPLFVLDDSLLASDYARPNRVQFLLESVADLDQSLRALGGRLVVRRGDPAHEAIAVARAAGAQAVFTSADVNAFARRRARRLAEGCAAHGVQHRAFPGVTVVAPGAVLPSGGDHFRVFMPYWNRWRALPLRARATKPRRLVLPSGLAAGALPKRRDLVSGATSPHPDTGRRDAGPHPARDMVSQGHHAVRRRPRRARRGEHLPSESLPPLRLCLARRGAVPLPPGRSKRGIPETTLLARFPSPGHRGIPGHRPHGLPPARPTLAPRCRTARGVEAGRTGYPIVGAGMRQLAVQGWMHNRARLLTASFLVKNLGMDWRLGARHFLDLLVDGDIANNAGNWQWVAGTGNDTRPNRTFNPIRQALRFDPDGTYVRRWLPELVSVPGPRVHTPWVLDPAERDRLEYCEPLVMLARGRA